METLQKELVDLHHTIRAAVAVLVELEGVSLEEYALKWGVSLHDLECIHLLMFDDVSNVVVKLLVGANTARKYEKLTRLAKIEKQQDWEELIYSFFFTGRNEVHGRTI